MADVPLLEAASRIADGDGVDWLAVTSTLRNDVDRAVADELALVQQIAQGHRQLHQLLPVAADTPAHLMPDRARWGHLDLLNVVGRGSYGIVYRAWDTRLERLVALKLFHGAANPDTVIQEGRMLARVRHENVVTVYGADVIDDVAGIWMELVHGETLDRIIRKSGALPAKEAASVGADVAMALGAVHAAGLLHCDVKAQNVVRETSGRVVLMDLGASRLVPELRDMDQPISDVAGTPRYMAPELFVTGAMPTKESDIYSLGILIFYLLTGQFPVDGKTLGELKRAHEAKRSKSLSEVRPDLSKRLSDVVARAIDRDPMLRPSSTIDLQTALTAVALAPPDGTKRLSRWMKSAASFFSTAAPSKREGPRLRLEPATITSESLQAALTTRRARMRYSTQAVPAAKLGAALDLTFGAQTHRHPIDAFVIAWNVKGVPLGVYHYDSGTKELVDLQKSITLKDVAPLFDHQTSFTNAAAVVIMCGVFARRGWGFSHSRAYRMALIAAGHLGQTFSLVSQALGLAPFTTMAFNERAVEELLGLNGVSECPVYIAGVGMPDPLA